MICFAILAHENEHILAQQVRNISDCNPGSRIVLYNSSGNPHFGRSIANLLICPYSRGPLAWGRTGRVLMDISAWLRETDMEYDYLVYIDSDVLFVRTGFEQFLDKVMLGYDCMGVNLHQEYAPGAWIPGQGMWREWHVWQPFFGTDYLCGIFANGQVYRRDLFHRMYDGVDKSWLERLIMSTEVVALEEILHPTLAVRCGARFRDYPVPAASFIRQEPIMSTAEAKTAQRMSNVFFMHPIRRMAGDPARRWIMDGVEVPVPRRKKRTYRKERIVRMSGMKRRASGKRRYAVRVAPKTTRKSNVRPSRTRVMRKVVKSPVNRRRKKSITA